ncbi:cMP-NeuNAc synthetase [Cryptobacterium sp. CAG:338]|jgi:sialic acid synthase SpsE|nr:cMP-NeuNAc synthetase [Cryptobacterium sp. CAG:338]
MNINKKKIGLGNPVYIIAEACDNHMGSLDAAKEMCRQAKLAGCDCIKFQHHLPDEEMLPDVPMTSNFDIPLYEFLKRYALTLDQHKELMDFCDEIGIQYLCTPFSLKAAQELNELGVAAFKIGSGEMDDIPMLKAIAKMGKPMIVSTGMATMDEIKRTYDVLADEGIEFALMNCLSEYPPCYEDVNLGVIEQMQSEFPKAVIGHSDHTPDLYTSFAAVAKGAKIIEKHVILDKRTPGPDQSVSIDFFELRQLVDGIRKVEAALGSEKKVHSSEKGIREWAHRSVVSLVDIPVGATITQEMIWSKRPGTGIPSYRMDEVIGKVAKREIKANTLVAWEDLG